MLIIMKGMTLKETCKYLSISEASGRNWIRQGLLTATYRGDDNRVYFDPKAVKKLKQDLQKKGKLTKRRNKTALSHRCLYTDYLSCTPEAARQLEQVVSFFYETGISLLQLIAHYAEEFFSANQTLTKFQPLIDEFLGSASNTTDISYSPKGEDLHAAFPPLSFQPCEDQLGYLYISLTQMDQRKQSGIYYTPSKPAQTLIRRTLSFSEDNDTFFDPACGTGNILLKLLALHNGYKLLGQDIDPIAVGIARINIALNCPDIAVETLRRTIRTADSLLDFSIQKNTLILGNPPWGAHVMPSGFPDTIKSKSCSRGKEDSASLFVQTALLNQEEDGIISFLLPASLLTAGQHAKMRKMILEQAQILSVNYLEQTFSKVDCPAVILILQKNTRQPGIRCCEVYKKSEHYTIRNRELAADSKLCKDCYFMLHANDEAYALFRKMDSLSNTVTLKGNADFALGIVTGNNQRFVIPAKTPSKTDPAPSQNLLPDRSSENPVRNTTGAPFPEPVIRGFNVEKYRIYGPFDRILFTPDQFQQCAPEQLYRTKEKLLYRFIGKTPVFAYDDRGTLTLNSCNILIPHIDGLNMKYILAVLNSRAAAFYWRTGFDSVKMLRSHIEALPIPLPSQKEQDVIISLTEKLITNFNYCDKIIAKNAIMTNSLCECDKIIAKSAIMTNSLCECDIMYETNDRTESNTRNHSMTTPAEMLRIQNLIDEKITKLYRLAAKERRLI